MSRTWYALLTTYMVLFFITGYITFFYNNIFATRSENIAKITKVYDDQEKFKLVEELLQDDAKTSQDENNISSQSFNVVLGAIVSFLSTTLAQKNNHKKNDYNNKI
ncbi:hypothetical protein [Planktothrix mougeotii]|uniref:Uncharacterized protein n=1 Tax=Planktothrix mougeotii LEGE 06226 TaxID=1828728 RepID=A0ABR9UCV3_9CYAN|nr:hypothetical protein [Planktothrix mougeotii]MBE9144302.1 hypothetical protein [Planktothrix mougeotii LEGE 06226]